MRVKKLNINSAFLLISRAILILALLVSAVGCSTTRSLPTFISKISKFDNPAAPQMILSEGNKVSDGRWSAMSAMAINPFVERNKVGGTVSLIGFVAAVEMNTFSKLVVMSDYSPITSLIFLADGDRIELKTDKNIDQRVLLELDKAGSGYYNFGETGIFSLSKIQYEKIMSAKTLELKVEGGTRDQEFYQGDIRPEFQGFLKEFYKTNIDR